MKSVSPMQIEASTFPMKFARNLRFEAGRRVDLWVDMASKNFDDGPRGIQWTWEHTDSA